MVDTLFLIKEIMHSDVEFITEKQRVRPEKSEVFRLMGNNQLIRGMTGWVPEIKIENGLAETCSWFANPLNLQKYKGTIYNI
jgi:nucleoside-diphosphate-sugar epimerase